MDFSYLFFLLHLLHNELLFFGYFIVLATTLLVALRMGKEYVIGMVAVLVVLANIFVVKPYDMFGFLGSISLFGYTLPFPITTYGGNAMFGAIFLATDLLAEHYGKKEAMKAVYVGFTSLFLYFITAMVYTSLSVSPTVEDQVWATAVNDSIITIFTPAFGIVVASLTAFTLSNTFDIHFYEFIKSYTGERHLWLRNNLSTICSQFIDTCTFSFIAVAFGFFDISVVWSVIFFAYIFKLMVALLDTPFVYLSKWTQKL